jgi:hypothetical protein
VHRDLKPSNVLLDPHGEPVVTDFGLARHIATGDARLTGMGAVIGTAAYIPPEQVGGNPETMGPSGDVYSLGVILYELLTGRPPFIGSAGEVLYQVVHGAPVPPSRLRPGVDPRLERACLQAMAREPSQRFASMAEFAAALRPVAEGAPRGTTRAWNWPIAIAAGVVAALIGLGLWAAFRSSGPSGSTSPSTASTYPPALDPFRVGSEWVGTYRFLPEGPPGPVSLVVTRRSGDAFNGTYQTDAGHRWEAAGKLGNGTVEWRLTKALTGQAEATGAAGTAVVKGTFADGVIDALYEDHDSQAKMTLRLANGRK